MSDQKCGVLFELENLEYSVEWEFGFGEGFGSTGVKDFLSAVGVSLES